jgi:deoxyribose-phosphate aldolase
MLRPNGRRVTSSPPNVSEGDAVRRAIEHTALAADVTPARIDRLCDEALAHGFFGVCVNPVHVARCRARLAGSRVRLVTVVGFPLGASMSECKAHEADLAVRAGADELDMVMAVGLAKAGDWTAVERDAAAVVRAAGGRPVKLILETGLLDAEEKARACGIAVEAGVAFVKTCTGFAAGTATVEDVRLLGVALAGRLPIKASGGIRTAVQAKALLAAGATRLGTSASVQIVGELGS